MNSFFKKIKKILPFFTKNRQSQDDLDKKLVYSMSKSRIPNLKQLKYIKKYLSKGEIWLLRVSFLVIFLNSLYLGFNFYKQHLQDVPAKGTLYSEALIGYPKHINPLYSSLNDVDNDISHLVYSSLFTYDKNGNLVPDLVEKYETNKDKTEYTVYIKKNVWWHENSKIKEPLNTDDIIFTFNTILNKEYNSPLRAMLEGSQAVKIDDYSLRFILPKQYPQFLNLLTFGVLPAKLWQNKSPDAFPLSDLNLKPLGSGPFMFKDLLKDKESGIIKEYNLVLNPNYYGKIPYLNLNFKFFPNSEEAINALNNSEVDALSYLPQNLKKDILTPKTFNFHKLKLPQMTAIFLNQEKNEFLKSKETRQALAYAINKKDIIDNILNNEARIIDKPFFFENSDIGKYDFNPEKAKELLKKDGWTLTEISDEDIKKAEEEKENKRTKEKAEKILKIGKGKWLKKDDDFFLINLKTLKRNENEEVVKKVKDYWEKIGIKTNITLFDNTEQAEVIAEKDFEALFFGFLAGPNSDPYLFWHSSQSEEGYNLSAFKNKEVDDLFEKIKKEKKEEQIRDYKKIEKIITEEEPVIFMYSPIYTYVQSIKLKNFDVNTIILPYNRFANICDWYNKTVKKLVW